MSVQCPDCCGRKEYVGVHGKHKCSRCDGSGVVPAIVLDWIARGKLMRAARVHGKKYRSLWEEAKRRGITAKELSDMENGRVQPIPA